MTTLIQPPAKVPDDAACDLLNNPVAETLRPLGYARKWWIPRNASNKPISPATINRWARKGVKGIRLPVLYTPAGAVTSEAACRQFLAEVDRMRRDGMATAAIDATEDQLRAVGLTSDAELAESELR